MKSKSSDASRHSPQSAWLYWRSGRGDWPLTTMSGLPSPPDSFIIIQDLVHLNCVVCTLAILCLYPSIRKMATRVWFAKRWGTYSPVVVLEGCVAAVQCFVLVVEHFISWKRLGITFLRFALLKPPATMRAASWCLVWSPVKVPCRSCKARTMSTRGGMYTAVMITDLN